MSTTRNNEKKDTSAIQNEIRGIEQDVENLENRIIILEKILEDIENCRKKWDSQRYTYRYNPNLSSTEISNKFEGNAQKTSKNMFNEAYKKMEDNYKKSEKLSAGIKTQISKLKTVISQKNRELSNKNAELRGYL